MELSTFVTNLHNMGLKSKSARREKLNQLEMHQSEQRKNFLPLKFLPVGIGILTVLTALVHLVLGLGTFWVASHGPAPVGSTPQGLVTIASLFLLNCIGYLALLVALSLPRLKQVRPSIRWLLIGYTALTIGVWYFIEFRHADLFDYSDKFIEVLLIALLLLDGWQTRRLPA